MRSTFLAALLSALFLSLTSNAETQMLPEQTKPCNPHPYIGMWVTTDGEFIDGVLHHAGMILYRED